jgi:cell division protein FtsZ
MLHNDANDAGGYPRITVVGVGGAGTNAVSYMVERGMSGTSVKAVDRDIAALKISKASSYLYIGDGLNVFCYASPTTLRQHCERYRDQFRTLVRQADIVCLTLGLGGGTGSGVASVLAEEAASFGAFVLAFVTLPFKFESRERTDHALAGLNALEKHVDMLVVVPNDSVAKLLDGRDCLSDAFSMSDKVLFMGVRAITEIFLLPACERPDVADIYKILNGKGYAALGIGFAEGMDRGVRAARYALTSPLLGKTVLSLADCIVVSVHGGSDMCAAEVAAIHGYVKTCVDPSTVLLVSSVITDGKQNEIQVTVIVMGTTIVQED